MAKFTLYVRTNMAGSKSERLIEIPEDEMEDLDEDERRDFIEEWMSDEMWNLIEWGYSEIVEV